MCVLRTLEQWSTLKSYYCRHYWRGAIERLELHLLPFLDTVLPLFTKFNVLFQAENPVIHMLHLECKLLFQQFISSNIKAEVIESSINSVDVDFTNSSNHLFLEDIFIGRNTRQLETVVDSSAVNRFVSLSFT